MRLFIGGFFSIYFIMAAMAFYGYMFRDAFGSKDFSVFMGGTICGGCVLIFGLVLFFTIMKP